MLKLLTLTLLLLPTAAFADSLQYTFNTMNGVSGSFVLDDSIPFSSGGAGGLLGTGYYPPSPVFSYRAFSPLLAGTYGAYSFAETGDDFILRGVSITDFRPPYDSALDLGKGDSWIERSIVSGPELNGRSVNWISIFEFLSPDALSSPSYIPPPPIHSPEYFQYAIGFSDGTNEYGGLATLAVVQSAAASVPEPSSLMLLSIGAFGVILLRRGMSSRHSSRQPER